MIIDNQREEDRLTESSLQSYWCVDCQRKHTVSERQDVACIECAWCGGFLHTCPFLAELFDRILSEKEYDQEWFEIADSVIAYYNNITELILDFYYCKNNKIRRYRGEEAEEVIREFGQEMLEDRMDEFWKTRWNTLTA